MPVGRYQWFKFVKFLASWPQPISYWFGKRGGDLCHLLDRPKRKAIQDNLRVVLGPGATTSEVKRTARLVNRNFGTYFAEFFGIGTFRGPFMSKRVRLVKAEYIDRAIEGGKGAVILTAHLSNWEIGAAVLASRGYRVMGVALEHDDRRLARLFRRMREARGYTTIPPEGSFRKCITALEEGKSICFVGERDIGVGGVDVEFFGRPTPFPIGPARIALAAGARLVPGFVIRQPDYSLTVTMEPPIAPPSGGGRKRKALAMTQVFASIVERYVRAHPEQWGVFHRVWDDAKSPGVTG